MDGLLTPGQLWNAAARPLPLASLRFLERLSTPPTSMEMVSHPEIISSSTVGHAASKHADPAIDNAISSRMDADAASNGLSHPPAALSEDAPGNRAQCDRDESSTRPISAPGCGSLSLAPLPGFFCTEGARAVGDVDIEAELSVAPSAEQLLTAVASLNAMSAERLQHGYNATTAASQAVAPPPPIWQSPLWGTGYVIAPAPPSELPVGLEPGLATPWDLQARRLDCRVEVGIQPSTGHAGPVHGQCFHPSLQFRHAILSNLTSFRFDRPPSRPPLPTPSTSSQPRALYP